MRKRKKEAQIECFCCQRKITLSHMSRHIVSFHPYFIPIWKIKLKERKEKIYGIKYWSERKQKDLSKTKT